MAELREKIARIICCFAVDNDSCSSCKENCSEFPFPICFPDIKEQTDQILTLYEEALPELAKKLGYVQLAEDQNLPSHLASKYIELRDEDWRKIKQV